MRYSILSVLTLSLLACSSGASRPSVDHSGDSREYHRRHRDGGAGSHAGVSLLPPSAYPTTLASGQSAPWGLAVDSTNVYWTNQGDGTVMSVPKAGGTITTLASGQGAPCSVASDGINVYWVNYFDQTVVSVPVTGGSPSTLATSQQDAWGLAIDSQNIYYTLDQPVMALPLGGGSVQQIGSASPVNGYAIAADSSGVYWTSSTGFVQSNSGAAYGVATDPAYGIALDASNVYWTVAGSGLVLQTAKTGGVVVILASGQASPFGVAVDASRVYWANQGDGSINYIPIGGGSLTQVYSGIGSYTNIVLDDTTIYWTDNGGNVMAMNKP